PTAPAFRVIADHLRSLSFAIADGAQPSNTDRGYVLRKILRRAVRYGRQLGFEEPFLGKLLGDLLGVMGDPYQELRKAQTRIEEILTREEEAFFKTLRRGGNILSRVIQESTQVISGDDAFLLKDTYGLPLEEIQLIAIDNGLSVDQARFEQLEVEAKERSKAARKTTAQVAEQSIFETIVQKTGKNTFSRSPLPELAGMVVALIKDGKPVEKLQAEEEGMIILDRTPFYAEMGGQVGDRGSITNPSFSFAVSEAKTPYQGIIAHVGRVEQGSVFVGDSVLSSIDRDRRDRIEANHTATHLLHFALHELLGEHTRQCGSLVSDEYLRFDFAHHKALTQEELDSVEQRVNELICENVPVLDYEIPLEEAQKHGDIKQFFGEKYGNTVRVLEVGPSKELCGGTHVVQTGKIGYFRIISESSIAAGVRRIEAVTGSHAVVEARAADKQLSELADLLKVPTAKLAERVARMDRDMKGLETELKALKRERMQLMVGSLTVTPVKSDHTIVSGALCVPAEELKMAADEIHARHPHAVIAIGCVAEGRAHLLVKVPQKAIASGLNAGLLLKQALPLVEGNGGGKAEMAQGAGKLGSMLEKALQQIVSACCV
ncbi:MAG: alanine--tRNA ligase, partial [Candidatus Marsarchaeota archaeon]|nr:alanine--tRNA ligase [Candidatus Marsarchaeota archaeon]